MKGRNKIFLIAFITAIALMGVFQYISHSKKERSIFINQTSDHRFDESIQVSIIAAKKRTGVDHAVVITDDISGDEDVDYKASKIFKELNLGSHSNGRAILYLFSPKMHLLKIEVGYALEGILPDSKVHFLEEAAKTFVYTNRYNDFWAELMITMGMEIQKEKTNQDASLEDFRFYSGGAGILSKSYSASLDQLEKEMLKEKIKYDENLKASPEVNVVLNRYLKTLESGLGSTDMDLLSMESRLFRSFTPMTKAQLHRNYKMYQEAGIDKIIEDKNYAFAFFRKNYPVLPIVFKKTEGMWRVQEALSWSLFARFEDSKNVYLKVPLESESKDLNQYLDQRFGRPVYYFAPKIHLEKIDVENSNQAEFFYFNYYWLSKAQEKFVETNANLWLKLELQTNLGKFSGFLETYKKLSSLYPEDKRMKNNLKFYKKTFVFDESQWILSAKF